jgi:hypothetical protein
MREEIEGTIFEVLAHNARRNILRIVAFGDDGASYTEVLSELELSTGRLNYHLKQLEGFIVKNERLRYNLTPLGKKAVDLMRAIDEESVDNLEKYMKVRKPESIMPALKAMAYILMVAEAVPIVFIIQQLYTEIISGGSLAFILFLCVALCIGLAVFTWLVYMVRHAPNMLKKVERRFYE